MNTARTDKFIFVGMLIVAFLILLSTIGQSTIDIQLYDTYFVLDRISLVISIIGPLTLLVYFARGLATKFRTRSTNIGVIIGLLLVAVITFQIIRFQESDLK